MDWIPPHWRTTLGGLLMAAAAGLQYAGQPAIGAGLLALGSLLLGTTAADKKVATEAVKEVKEQVQVVKAQVRGMQDVATERAFLSQRPLGPK